MIQNPGRVLCHILMMGLLSQVMDNEIVNVVKAKDSATLAGGKTQSVSSQVVEVNVVKEVNPGQVLQNQVVDDVNVDVVNEDNPGQVLQNQVGDNGNMENLEQVLLSLEEVNAVDAVDAETKEKAVNAVDAENKDKAVNAVEDGNMVNKDNPEQVVEMNIVNEDHREVDMIDSDCDCGRDRLQW
jgi:hypothetical protein